MTSIFRRTPAMLAVLAAVALMFAVGGVKQTAYAASDPFYVWLDTIDEQYVALPGEELELQATQLDANRDDSRFSDEDMDFRWEIVEGSEYASIIPNSKHPSLASVRFNDLPKPDEAYAEDQVDIEYEEMVIVRVTAYYNGKKQSNDVLYLTVSNDFYQLSPKTLQASYYGVNKVIDTPVVKVEHCTSVYEEGKTQEEMNRREPVDNVKFTWEYEPADIRIEGPDGAASATGSEVPFEITRLSGEPAAFGLLAEWDGMSEETWFWIDQVPTDLNDYAVDFIYPGILDNWYYEVDAKAGETFDLIGDDPEDPIVKPYVQSGSEVLEEGKDYTLTVERYSYDPETGEETETPVDPSQPQELDEDGIAMYIYTATAVEGSGYTGSTIDQEGFLFVSSRYSVAGFGADISLNQNYLRYLDEEPYIRYEVKPGTILTPSVSVGGDTLIRGTDYEISYVSLLTGEEQEKFPTRAGTYVMKVTGIGDYFGVDDFNNIKVGYENPMTVKTKTIKVKADKKKKKTIKNKKFAAKKAFTVKNAKGTVTYKKVSGSKKITVASNGKVTVKKGLKKGKTYKVKVRVTDGGDDYYMDGSKTVTFKVKIK